MGNASDRGRLASHIDWSGFVEQARAIAQQGLVYSSDPHDRVRFERLLELASDCVACVTELDASLIRDRFLKETGYITPKVGVEAAVFDQAGRLLLMRRSDDGLWGLPTGYSEPGESSEESVVREVLEETGLSVRPIRVMYVFTRLPNPPEDLFTTYSIAYHCERVGGHLHTTPEALETEFLDPLGIQSWHKDHRLRAERCVRYWNEPGAREV
jgi:ADP-ribose pyrophosphatase YjhB (NUDIX family)